MLSPFSSHLGTNYFASESEKAQIQQLLKGHIEDNQRIDCEIEELRQQLEALIHKREENDHFIEPHLALSAPIRGLPNELLRTIFSHCLPNPTRLWEDPFDNREYMSAAQPPMLLTFICQRWRQIALDFPELWQRAPINVSPSLQSPTDLDLAVQNASQLAQLWLSRAGNRPVAISISWKLSHAWTNFEKFLPFLTQHSSQWKELRISASDMNRGLLKSILSLPSSSIPNLQNLEIPAWVLDDKKCLLGGPSIRRFRYDTFGYRSEAFDHDFIKIPLQWPQLTDLDIASMKTTDTNIWKTLVNCPRLERLRISINFVEIFEPYSSPRLLLSHLVLLHIRHVAPVPLTGFFESLRLPSLKDLTLHTHRLGDFLPAAIVGESGATLRRLAVRTLYSTAATQTLLETLALTTQLEFLEIGFISYLRSSYTLLSDTFLAALTPGKDENPSASPNTSSRSEPQQARLTDGPNSSPYLCPNLQDIKLGIITGPSVDEVIFNFIKGRRERSATLRSVSLIYARYAGEREKGMQEVNVLGVTVNTNYEDSS